MKSVSRVKKILENVSCGQVITLVKMIASKLVLGRASRTEFGLKFIFEGSPENFQALVHSMNLTMKILKLTILLIKVILYQRSSGVIVQNKTKAPTFTNDSIFTTVKFDFALKKWIDSK